MAMLFRPFRPPADAFSPIVGHVPPESASDAKERATYFTIAAGHADARPGHAGRERAPCVLSRRCRRADLPRNARRRRRAMPRDIIAGAQGIFSALCVMPQAGRRMKFAVIGQ